MPVTMPIRKPSFVPLARLYQTMAYVLCMIAMVLEDGGYIRRDTGQPRGGSLIYVERWLEDEGFAKIPKSWLYHGRGPKKDQSTDNPETTLVKLKAFGFNKRITLQALKIYVLLLAMRHSDFPRDDGLTVISYDKISDYTGVGRHEVSPAITLLIEMNLITFRSGDQGGYDGWTLTGLTAT
ncbi:hypothetical protein [Pseudomonas sp. PLMAX]|uniref:hypothetical protein n=1 Tax=Pseudomonas sp. PLMAX TaxID=2201998 RepID=UPI0038BB55ED